MDDAEVKLVPPVLIERARMMCRKVLLPSVIRERAPLRIEVYQTAARLPLAAARRSGGYRPVNIPFRWGPSWSTAWFRMAGRVPRHWAGGEVVLHAVMNHEGLLWRDGKPFHGISPFHCRIPLFARCRGNETLRLYLEAAANQLFGQLKEVSADGAATPALVSALELALVDPAVMRYAVDLEFAGELLEVSLDLINKSRDWGGWTPPLLLPPAARGLARALDESLNRLREHDLAGTVAAAHRTLLPALTAAGGAATECRAAGHSHIDVAWLWPLAETRRKCSRTFSTMLRHMERDKDFVYQQSQAQLYAFIAEDYPELLRQIKRRVRQGRWEAGGGMWVEADCNLASGEALVRQLLHGILYWRKLFGPAYGHRYLWLPDVFGYTAALPQILRHCGIDTFFTQKISWNDTNRFPHTSFWWRGIDGSNVLSHFFPSDSYNGQVKPLELLRADYGNQQSDQVPFWFNPVGYGDGGGGPNREILHRVRTAQNAPFLPRVRYQLPGAFAGDLHAAAKRRSLPVWRGELYLELHRGTLTTQARVKRGNRLAELGLREIELWSSLAWGGARRYPAAAFDRLWKTVLLHQFHDVLPGSSIETVYRDAQRDYDAVLRAIDEHRNRALAALASRLPRSAAGRKVHAVFNAAETARNGVVELPRGKRTVAPRLVYVRKVPGLGVKLAETATAELPAGVVPVKATERTLDNGILRVRIDAAGRVRSLAGSGRDAVAVGAPMNQLVLYEDRPNQYDAWDINLHYLKMGDPVRTRADIRLLQNNPLRSEIEVRRRLGKASMLVQRIRLDAGSPHLDFVTTVDWKESNRLLRVLHPVNVISDSATYEIQFGHVRRPTHFNTSWDSARFEAPAHTWMDLSERGFGVAMLNDCKYGHSCIGNVMGLSLLRSPKHPDENADMGEHRFTYSLMLHDGDPIVAGVSEAARGLNIPLRVVPLAQRAGNTAAAPIPPLEVPPGIRVECFKKAENSGDLVVRLVETAGRRHTAAIRLHLPVKTVRAVDALEQPTGLFRIRHNVGRHVVRVPFTPFAIRTLKVTQ